MCFSRYLGIGCVCVGGGFSPKGLVHTTGLCSFSPWAPQKLKFPKLVFCHIVTTQNDHPTYVKHVLGSMCVFLLYLGIGCRGGGVLPRDWYTTYFCSFSPWAAQKLKFAKLIFLIS